MTPESCYRILFYILHEIEDGVIDRRRIAVAEEYQLAA